MMTAHNMYLQNSGSNQRLIQSITKYIRRYADTSNKKVDRIESARHAKEILETVCIIIKSNNEISHILFNGFNLILVKVTRAIMNPDVLQDFNKEIAFLEVLAV